MRDSDTHIEGVDGHLNVRDPLHMTVDEIRELIQLVNETGIAELEVARGENRVRIRRSGAGAAQRIVVPQSAETSASLTAMPVSLPAARSQNTDSEAASALPSTPVDEDKLSYVKSPIVGTFYESSSPGAPPFVKVGDRVSVGQILCIIESMKLMNEIECEVAGTVVRKLVESGRPVEYGESLFAIQPA